MSRRIPKFVTIDNGYLELAEKIFMNPTVNYKHGEIVNGVVVDMRVCRIFMQAVASNTFRGFHRNDKKQDGASVIFKKIFSMNKIIQRLEKIKNRNELDKLSNALCRLIRFSCRGNIKSQQIKSFNKIRKPVDLYIEHLVSMASELKDHREKLVPLLYLPLDSWIIGYEGVGENELFSDNDLKNAGIQRKSTYGEISEKSYYLLQDVVVERAKELSEKLEADFYPIYYDLIWGERYLKNNAKNLFQSNPHKI